MAKWSLPDKLQPSLLDRLTDLHPEKETDSLAERVLGHEQFRAAVIRDLGWLLNSVSLDSVEDLSKFPEVSRSVLNYGLPDLSGHTASSIDPLLLEKALKDVIRQFEPRIAPESLKIRVHSRPEEMNFNSLVFDIEGVVFGQPMPFEMALRSELDLESGEFEIREGRG